MIKEATGDLLRADVDALVNTVNTVGVMGKGIALQFKRAYPEMFREYVRAAKAGDVARGRMHVWPTGAMGGPKFIINFPTKGHWRSPSRLEDIESGLRDLVEVIRHLGIRSIAVPPLGAGSGGLDWGDVEPLIRRAFGGVSDVEVLLYPPQESPRAAEMRNVTPRPDMTLGRAAMVRVLAQYSRFAVTASLVEIQK
jgi:O-acetyl-ADP-ribose deacetylase (regulator of RNase III)